MLIFFFFSLNIIFVLFNLYYVIYILSILLIAIFPQILSESPLITIKVFTNIKFINKKSLY